MDEYGDFNLDLKSINDEGHSSKTVRGAIDSKGKPKLIRQFADLTNP